MFEMLIKYIQQYSFTTLTESEIEIIKNTFIHKKYRKHQFFHQEGEICKYTGFIVKGAMRQYSIDDNGKEHIVSLCIENWWVGDRESFIKEIPSKYFVEAWEPTELLFISRIDTLNLLKTIPALAELSKNLDEQEAIALINRVSAAISLSAEQRYAELKKTYPEFLQRFPQHIIASYLGMTKETLSRIRSTDVKK